MSHKSCVICGKRITYTFWVCSACEGRHGLDGIPYRNWPEWTKLLVRTSRRQTTIDRREVAFSSMGFDPFEYLTNDS